MIQPWRPEMPITTTHSQKKQNIRRGKKTDKIVTCRSKRRSTDSQQMPGDYPREGHRTLLTSPYPGNKATCEAYSEVDRLRNRAA